MRHERHDQMRRPRRSRPRPVATVALLSSSLLPAGCVRSGDGGSGIEDAAWTAAGAEDVEFDREAQDDRLVVVVETSLPIDDARDPQAYATRVAQIVWRTHPEAFTELAVTTRHDDTTVTDARVFTADELTAEYGDRPTGLDDGVARRPPEPADDESTEWEELADRSPDEALDQWFEPLLARTAADEFDVADAGFERTEPDECLTGLNGDQPTGRSRRSTSTVVAVDGPATAVLADLGDQWLDEGLAVQLATFDAGGDQIGVRFDGVGSVAATARGDQLVLSATTDCLRPD